MRATFSEAQKLVKRNNEKHKYKKRAPQATVRGPPLATLTTAVMVRLVRQMINTAQVHQMTESINGWSVMARPLIKSG